MRVRVSKDKKLSQLGSNGLRPFQNQVYQHRDEKIIVINAMTGAGKSICSQTIALHKLADGQIKRVIIAVPQKSIGVNFREYPVAAFEHADKYRVSLDLIDTNNTTERLQQFLEHGEGICICTHSTLIASAPSESQFHDTLLVVDEAHHVSASEEAMNHLGFCVTNSMESSGHTLLMTATPFRSDAAAVVPQGFDYVSSFFSITEFLKDCVHLHGINTEFDIHECDSYLERINEIDFSRKTAIYIPVTDSYEVRGLFDKESKQEHITELVNQIGTPQGRDENGFYLVEREGKVLRIADLVNDEGEQQEALDSTRKTGECDIVLSMSKAKEGWDYPCIEQVVIVGARGSLSDTLQMIGRGVRDYPGKETCFVRILAQIADVSSEDVREQTSRFLKTVYCAQLLEDIMIPASLFNLRRIPKDDGGQEDILPKVKDAIEDTAINARIGEAIRNLPISVQLGSKSEIQEAVLGIIRKELPDMNEAELEQFERALKTARFIRQEVIQKELSLEFAGTINVDDIDFAVIDDMSHVADAVEVLAKGMGLERFELLRDSLVKDFYETLEEASQAAQKLGCTSGSEYGEEYKKDPRLHSMPMRFYIEDWKTWNDFLGKEEAVEKYATLQEASQSAQKLGLKTKGEYDQYYKRDVRLPAAPYLSYKEDWTNFTEFLGRKKSRRYETLHDASQATQRLGITSNGQYRKEYKQDPLLVVNPHREYASDWESWEYYFGKDKYHSSNYSTVNEASKAAQKLKIRTRKVYQKDKAYKQDPLLPAAPDVFYKKTWTSWSDFLGNESQVSNYISLEEASNSAQRLKFTTQKEYKDNYKQDPHLPYNPDREYKNDWDTWSSFLGKAERIPYYSTVGEASKAAQKLKINSNTQYRAKYKQDPHLPSMPERAYKVEWREDAWTWSRFLGKEESIDKYITIKEASNAARNLGIKTGNEYTKEKAYKRDPQLPASPERTYKKYWKTWSDFLGTNKKLEATEGKETIELKEHKKKERNTSLVKKIKQKRLAETGKLACDDCGFSFDDEGFDYIQAHHDSKRHAELAAEGEVVSEDDFRLLCPNCHIIAHKKF